MESNNNNNNNMVDEFERAELVEKATTRAIDLIREYSEQDPDDDEKKKKNPWRNPQKMLQEMDQARQQVLAAWGAAVREENKSMNHNTNGEEDDFRAAYMDRITDAFADVLENLRTNESGELDIDILVDCLQSGMDLLSTDEKSFFLVEQDESSSSTTTGDDGNNSGGVASGSSHTDTTPKLTPHEQRRRQLGFHVPVT